jgi:membrane-associated phospholipid phosphatase
MKLRFRFLGLVLPLAAFQVGFASPFVNSPAEIALSIGALGAAAALEQWPPNSSHPLIGGEQKPYISRERVPDWALAVTHIATFCTIRFSQSADRVRYAHGYDMAVALTQLATSATKGVVGRKRPNEDDARLLGESTKSRSFFSGHASTTFCLATYTTLFTRRTTDRLLYRTGVPLVTFSAATYAAWSRVAEHRHYPSDVIVGAAAGTAIGALVFRWYDGMEPRENSSAGITILPMPRGASLAIFF